MSARAMPLFAVGAVMLWTTAAAQTPAPGQVRNLSIPAEPLANALNDLAQQSGLQVMFASERVARLRSSEVKGLLTPEEALQRLLSNTGLHFEFVNPHTITIVGPSQKPSPPEKQPGSPDANPPVEKGHATDQTNTAPHIHRDPEMPRRNLFARW